MQNAAEYVCREWFDEVLIVLPEGREIPQKVFDAFAEMGITIHVKIADVNEMQGKNQTVERMGNYTVVTTCINMASAGQLVLKRIMDICGGLAGCILTGIIFLFVAPAIYIKSPARSSSHSTVSERTEENSKFTSSVACTWMRKSGKKN